MFPDIAFAGPEWSRRATVVGTGWDVWQIVVAVRDFGSAEGLTEVFNLTEREVRAALSYAERFPEEIEQQIAENERPIEELRRDYPFAEVVTVD